MYFALFILEQLKEEVDTMMSGGLERSWVEELSTHTKIQEPKLTQTEVCRYTHKLLNDCGLTASPGSPVQQNSCLRSPLFCCYEDALKKQGNLWNFQTWPDIISSWASNQHLSLQNFFHKYSLNAKLVSWIRRLCSKYLRSGTELTNNLGLFSCLFWNVYANHAPLNVQIYNSNKLGKNT